MGWGQREQQAGRAYQAAAAAPAVCQATRCCPLTNAFPQRLPLTIQVEHKACGRGGVQECMMA